MDACDIAPCGLNCALCGAYTRARDRCSGCNGSGPRASHCLSCRIRHCPEKPGGEAAPCSACPRFPCPRIRNLDKRYRTKYGQSCVANFAELAALGTEAFLRSQAERWACPACGALLCTHKAACPRCGAPNPRYPREAHARTRSTEETP